MRVLAWPPCLRKNNICSKIIKINFPRTGTRVSHVCRERGRIWCVGGGEGEGQGMGLSGGGGGRGRNDEREALFLIFQYFILGIWLLGLVDL